MLLAGLLFSASAQAQEMGDYRSAAVGEWSAAATWQTWDGSAWTAATTAPTGAEMITIAGTDTVTVDVAVVITDTVMVSETGRLAVEEGTLEFASGGVYNHARDAGDVPEALWSEGSTFLLTGTVQDAPGDRSQNFYNVTLDTPNLARNRDLGWDNVTIGGDVTLLNSNNSRWQLSSTAANDTAAFAIMGDVVVENGQFAVQGTGTAYTTFIVNHYGDIRVTGGNFSIARGSQGSGTGTTTWYLHGGDFIASDAKTQNSNPVEGNAKFVFDGDGTQLLSFTNVEYGGGSIDFAVSAATTLEVADGFSLDGLFVNEGTVTPLGSFTVLDGAVYEHARNGGTVPSATWMQGSTALFTGITTTTPDNRGQDYYNLTLNTPGLTSNKDLGLAGHTISGDLSVLASGSSRWRLVGGESDTVAIRGDVIVRGASLETQGTSSATNVVIEHYGNIDVDGGNFSIARGSQDGTGTTKWYLYKGDFMMANARTQNSNATGSWFVFAADSVQHLVLGDGNTIDNLAIEVSDSTTLDLGKSVIPGNGIFVLQDGGTLVTSHTGGIMGNIQTTGNVMLGTMGRYVYNGTEAQDLGVFPDSALALTVANLAGVATADTNFVATLIVDEGATLRVDSTGSLTANGGVISGTVVNKGELMAETTLGFMGTSVYEHARDGGSIPSGVWSEGSTAILTGIKSTAPDNRAQDYYNLVFNTPEQLSNLNMGFDGQTISGDVRVVNTGAARWYLMSVPAQDTANVTILGDVIVEDGQFAPQGTGNAMTSFVVDHYGDVVVTGGNFSIARGSQGSGSGSTRWVLHRGDFSLSNARTQNSNGAGAWFVFAADSVQHLTLGEGNTLDNLPVEVLGGATLDMGTSVLTGSGLFTLNEGAMLATALPGGVAGAVQTTGTVLLGEGAGYVFNGTEAQVTSTALPMMVAQLVIDNEAGVKLSQPTFVTDVVRLLAGQFDNTIPFTLGEGAKITSEGGTLLIAVASEELADVPTSFELYQNYPNPFASTSTIPYDVSAAAQVSITLYDVTGREVMVLLDEQRAPGRYRVDLNPVSLPSGLYFYRLQAGDWSETRKLHVVR